MTLTARLQHRLPLTRIKLLIAGLIYVLIRPFLTSGRVRVRRRGITYRLDLSEGIDLAVFLFGRFQGDLIRKSLALLPEDAVIFDVGANLGSMALPLCMSLPRSRVHAFEPADEAHAKLLTHLALNPALGARIHPVKRFVSHTEAGVSDVPATASWKINDWVSPRHPVSGGMVAPSTGTSVLSLDGYCRSQAIDRLDLIKIDTEGRELDVITGAQACIARFRPLIIFEAGGYLMKENGYGFDDLADILGPLGYRFFRLSDHKKITRKNAGRLIPRLSTIDILAEASMPSR
ncbi:hypothetical protein JCM14469_16270 [Desulfatiferula olefinivorans]